MYKEIDRNKRFSIIILLVFVVFICLLGYVYGQLSDLGYFGVILALVFAFPSAFIGYYTSDRIVLYLAGAKEIVKKDDPILFNTVENLSIASGMTTPRVYIIEDEALNAFATGRDPQHAAIAITRGLLDKLEKVELEGVIAHELSHIKNFDTRLSMLVVVFVGMVTIMADIFWRSRWLRGRNNKKNDIGGLIAILGLIFIILSPVVAKILQYSLSRNREFLADSEAALLTRYPDGLVKALEKISNQDLLLKNNNNAMNHLYIISPLDSTAGKQEKSWMSNLFSTHPPVGERIARLKNMI